MTDSTESAAGQEPGVVRKGFTRRRAVTTGAAVVTIGAAAVTGVVQVVRFVNPRPRFRAREAFVAFTHEVPEGAALEVGLPDGRRVQVTRLGSSFAGFSNVCPHLGCRVSWQPPNEDAPDERKKGGCFRCPCHEGYFAPDGKAFQGPPADAGQDLSRVPLEVRGNALYVVYEEEVS